MDTASQTTLFSEVILEAGKQFKDGIILFDLVQLNIIYANEMAETLLGPLSSLSTENYEPLLLQIAPEHRAYVQDQVKWMFLRQCSGEIEFRIRNQIKEEEDHLLCCSTYFLVRSNQLLIHIADITKSKSQQDFLTEFGTKKNTLLETMTHHFSGALMLMQHLTKQVKETIGDSNNTELIQYINLLSANTASCMSMMDNLLNEEHLKSPYIAVKKFRVDIVERVYFVYDNLVKAFPSRAISYDTVAPSLFVYTDEFKMLQIVNNFVSNAIKFTPPDKQIAISIYQTEKNVVISVEDEGMGIPERLQPFVFEKNSIAGRLGLANEQSHGYGLYISRTLAESMNASIEYETEENKGSIFYLLLPRIQQDVS